MKIIINNINFMGKRILVWVVVAALIAGNIFWLAAYFKTQREAEGMRVLLSTARYNDKSLRFLQMFIKQVLKSEKEVNFETRLKLENSVRELNDDKILAQWQKFVNSQNETEAQGNVKELLDLLVDKGLTK